MSKPVPTSFQNTTGAWWQGAKDEQDRKDNGQFGTGGGSEKENTKIDETEHHEVHKHSGMHGGKRIMDDYFTLKPKGSESWRHLGLSDPVNYQANASGHRVLDFRSHEEAKHASGIIGKNLVFKKDAQKMKRQWDKKSK